MASVFGRRTLGRVGPMLLALSAIAGACRCSKPGPHGQKAEKPPPPGAVSPVPCFGHSGVTRGGGIRLELEASRVEGVAPLSVVFDTVGTTGEDARDRPFHDLEYCWDFGDPNSGRFTTTGLSKNEAKGPLAAHVFERPGTYTVRVSARDRRGHVATRAVAIHVEDPERVFAGERTVCLSARGNFDGCPSGGKRVVGSSLSALAPHVKSGRRLLLRRGDAFHGARLELNLPGPVLIGAFGAGDRPRLTCPEPAFELSGEPPHLSDLRITDLDVRGPLLGSGLVEIDGKTSDLLLLRVRSAGMTSAFMASVGMIDHHRARSGNLSQDIPDRVVVQDSEMRDSRGGGTLLFLAARRLAMLGNRYESSGEHVLRITWADRALISNNVIGGASPGKHAIKLHAPGFDEEGIGRGRVSERIVLSDNVFRGGGEDWTVSIGPQNAQSDERVRDLLVERNLFLPGPRVSIPLQLSGEDLTVRNNIFDRGPRGDTCIAVGRRGIEPPSIRVVIVHNTCVSRGDAPTLVTIDESASEIHVHNNWVAGARLGAVVSGPTERVRQLGNVVTVEPRFVENHSSEWAAFSPLPGSPAIDAAELSMSTTWDFSGRPRLVDGDGSTIAKPDVGALEYAPSRTRSNAR
ncbi:MAG TPA: PKD domain-containing protein [Polyangiaceae bacterium]|nr:PKD domain-containing protein [Polyangiaceae bacterium]